MSGRIRAGFLSAFSILLICLLLEACGVTPSNNATGGGGLGQATMTVTPSSLSFGNQPVNTMSAPQTVTIANGSSSAFTVNSVTPSGPFQVSGFTGATMLNPSQQLTLSVTFLPTGTGAAAGTLTISGTANNPSVIVNLSGTGVQNTVSVSPTSLNFGNQAVGTTSAVQTVTLTNTGTVNVNISTLAVTPSEFQLTSGVAPQTLAPGASASFSLDFAPDKAQSFSGQFTINSDAPTSPTVVPLSGTGTSSSGGGSTVTPSSLAFGNQEVGTTSASQKVTISNTGTQSFTVTGASTAAPFAVSGFSGNVVLSPGQSLPLTVTFSPSAVGSFTGTLLITYSNLPSNGVSLSGTGTAATGLVITTASLLPAATQNAQYLATLEASGGAPPYSWSATGLPSGLMLSSSTGTISGTANTSSIGNLSFTAQVTDSSSNTATATLTLFVGSPTGANCNNIFIDVGNPTPEGDPTVGTPVVPLNDLGTGTYLGAEGGLYGSGSNQRPAAHDAQGVSLADAIQPLDGNGNPDSSGKYVLLSIGMSNANEDFAQFINLAAADPAVNHTSLVIVNGAQFGQTAKEISNPDATFWSNIINTYLPDAHVTANQVVAAWVYEADGMPSGTFPSDMTVLQSELETIDQILLTKFPNIKLVYYTSREYGGYANKISNLNPEPFAYETAFAVRGMIEDQLNGTLVNAPWLSWSAYTWANGLIARSDGMVYSCQDFEGDGTHPALSARLKVANLLLNFFKTDDTTTPWFLAH